MVEDTVKMKKSKNLGEKREKKNYTTEDLLKGVLVLHDDARSSSFEHMSKYVTLMNKKR